MLDRALKQRRVEHPRRVTHRAYFPPHGRAWWLEIQAIERPLWFAEVDATAEDDNRLTIKTANAERLALRPNPALCDPNRPLVVVADGREAFRGLCAATEEPRLAKGPDGWTAAVEPRREPSWLDWKDFEIGVVDEPPTWEGVPETTLGDWLNDAMLDVSGADVAICTKGHGRYGDKSRGRGVEAGQTVRFIGLVTWLRPFDAALATFTIKGSDLAPGPRDRGEGRMTDPRRVDSASSIHASWRSARGGIDARLWVVISHSAAAESSLDQRSTRTHGVGPSAEDRDEIRLDPTMDFRRFFVAVRASLFDKTRMGRFVTSRRSSRRRR